MAGRDKVKEQAKKRKLQHSKALIKHELYAQNGIRGVTNSEGVLNKSGLQGDAVYIMFLVSVPPEMQDKFCMNCECEYCTGIKDQIMEGALREHQS